MNLRYPHARLSVYDHLMVDKEPCARALIKGAYESGLLPEGALDGLSLPPGCACGAFFAARKVLEKTFEEKGRQSGGGPSSESLESAWQAVEKDICECQKRYGIKEHTTSMKNHDRIECSLIVPAIMDFVLQRVAPYV